MHRFMLVTFLLTTLSVSTPSLLHAGGLGMGVMTPTWQLIFRPDVQKELKMSQKQTEDASEVQKSMNQGYQDLNKLPLKERFRKQKEMLTRLEKRAMKLLGSEQVQRLEQIGRWINVQRLTWPMALQTPPLSTQIKLTRRQQAMIQSLINLEQRQAIAQLRNLRNPDPKRAMEAARKRTDQTIFRKVLTRAQMNKLRALFGKKFTPAAVGG